MRIGHQLPRFIFYHFIKFSWNGTKFWKWKFTKCGQSSAISFRQHGSLQCHIIWLTWVVMDLKSKSPFLPHMFLQHSTVHLLPPTVATFKDIFVQIFETSQPIRLIWVDLLLFPIIVFCFLSFTCDNSFIHYNDLHQSILWSCWKYVVLGKFIYLWYF